MDEEEVLIKEKEKDDMKNDIMINTREKQKNGELISEPKEEQKEYEIILPQIINPIEKTKNDLQQIENSNNNIKPNEEINERINLNINNEESDEESFETIAKDEIFYRKLRSLPL